jgi:hypothetical protein
MKIRILLSALFCLSCYFSQAQMPGMGGQNGGMMNGMNNVPQGTSNSGRSKKDEPPHGGEVKESGKYYIEIVFDSFAADEKFSVWVLKSNFKPAKIDKATGKINIKYVKTEGKEETRDMVISDDRFICNVEDVSQAFTAFITITIKGKEYRAVYNHKAMVK